MTVNRPVTPGDIARATPAALEERSSRCGTIRDVEAKIKDGLTISNLVRAVLVSQKVRSLD